MSGSFIYRHHVEPRVKLYSPREESFPIPLKYIDVTRTTHTNLDVKQEKRIDDYWNIDGTRDLSDPWTGFTQFTLLEEKPPDGYMWSGRRLTRKQLTSRPDHLWPELWKSMGKHAENLVDDEIPLQGGSHASSSHEVLLEPTTKRREDLGKHSVYTHFLQDRNWEICKRTKITRALVQKTQWRSRTSSRKFWWHDNSRSQGPKRQLRISKQSSMCSRGAGPSYPMDSGVSVQKKTSQETQRSLQKFLEPERKIIYTANSLEFGKACEDLSWNHCTSTPHRSETNGIAERAVRRVKEWTSAVLLQSGLNESWWADSVECYTYLRNIQDLLSDGKTLCERRLEVPFIGLVVPFWSDGRI